MADLAKAGKLKETKSRELDRQHDHLQKEINEVDRDVQELETCKTVLQAEISEETAYQDQMRSMIAQLKRNIYEVKNDRERILKEINQGKKIVTNLQRMRCTLTEDKEKMQADFRTAFDNQTRGSKADLNASQIKSNMSTISKLTGTQRKRSSISGTAKLSQTGSIAKMKPLKF